MSAWAITDTEQHDPGPTWSCSIGRHRCCSTAVLPQQKRLKHHSRAGGYIAAYKQRDVFASIHTARLG